MRSVVWANAALADLRGQIAYIAKDDHDAALRVADRLVQAGANLGVALTGRPGRLENMYEKSVVGVPYIIAYAVDRGSREEETVVILRIIHSSRDWKPGSWPA